MNSFSKKTVKDIDVSGQTVLVRCDYNVLNEAGEIIDEYRLAKTKDTIQYLLKQECRIVLCSHVGRPGGEPKPKLSLQPIAEELEDLLATDVQFVDDCVGPEVEQAAGGLASGEVLLLENLRFHPGETDNEKSFAKQLAGLADVFVQDAFGVAHRAHASTDAITQFLPSVAGFLLEKEITTLSQAIGDPKRPFVAIIGGAKIASKLGAIKALIPKVDQLVVGGAMANTFFQHPMFDFPIGQSLWKQEELKTVDKILEQIGRERQLDWEDLSQFLLLPTEDVAVAKTLDKQAKRREVNPHQVADNEHILDFGSQSLRRVNSVLAQAGTVIWSGPLGMVELPRFAAGSKLVAETISKSASYSIVGGGDTAGFIHKYNLEDGFDWISTGGGASLQLLADQPLPAYQNLDDR